MSVPPQRAAERVAEMLTWGPRGATDPDDVRVSLAVLDRIADGEPVGRTDLLALAGASGDDEPHARADRVASLAEVDGAGAIIGIHGLSLEPTAYRLRLPRGERGTWCALDTLFLPPLLRVPAEVEGQCTVSGAPVSLRLDPDGFLRIAEPASLAVTFPLPDEATAPRTHDELRAMFCAHSRFATSLEEAVRVAGDGVEALAAEQAAELGRGIADELRARAH